MTDTERDQLIAMLIAAVEGLLYDPDADAVQTAKEALAEAKRLGFEVVDP